MVDETGLARRPVRHDNGQRKGGTSMTNPSIAELQEIARVNFGRELSEAQAETYRGRLPTMAWIVQRIRQLAPRLREAHPAQVMRVSETRRHD
jgi:hypothetical protein